MEKNLSVAVRARIGKKKDMIRAIDHNLNLDHVVRIRACLAQKTCPVRFIIEATEVGGTKADIDEWVYNEAMQKVRDLDNFKDVFVKFDYQNQNYIKIKRRKSGTKIFITIYFSKAFVEKHLF